MSADVQVIAPLFVGGGTVEGAIRVTVDNAETARPRRDLFLSDITVDLLGIEEAVSQNRKAIFLSLATDILDVDRPPPREMVVSSDIEPSNRNLWTLRASASTLPFQLDLPLDVGPAPFRSKSARIYYLLCVTLTIRDSGKLYQVRSSQEVTILSTYDRTL